MYKGKQQTGQRRSCSISTLWLEGRCGGSQGWLYSKYKFRGEMRWCGQSIYSIVEWFDKFTCRSYLFSAIQLVLLPCLLIYRSQGQRNRFSGLTSQRLKKDIGIKTTPSGWWYVPTIYSPWFVTREFGEVRWDRWVCSKWNDPLFSCLHFCCPQTNKESEKTYA